jgi:hypothetical protein
MILNPFSQVNVKNINIFIIPLYWFREMFVVSTPDLQKKSCFFLIFRKAAEFYCAHFRASVWTVAGTITNLSPENPPLWIPSYRSHHAAIYVEARCYILILFSNVNIVPFMTRTNPIPVPSKSYVEFLTCIRTVTCIILRGNDYPV